MFATAAAIFSVLLIITGVAKVASPHDVERALVAPEMPRFPFAGAVVGVVEIVVGAAAFFAPTALLAQGLLYLGFAGWVLVALRRDVPLASCGCLGKDDTPPTWGHMFMNVVAGGLSLAAAANGPIDMAGGLEGIAMIVVIAVGVFLAYVILNDGARLVAVRSR
jgi:hypothetical protein